MYALTQPRPRVCCDARRPGEKERDRVLEAQRSETGQYLRREVFECQCGGQSRSDRGQVRPQNVRLTCGKVNRLLATDEEWPTIVR